MNNDAEDLDESEYVNEALCQRDLSEHESAPLLGNEVPQISNDGNPSLLWLLPPFFFTAIMSGAAITPRLSLISDLLCRSYYASEDLPSGLSNYMASTTSVQINCNIPAISGQIARMSTTLNTLTGLLAAITAAKFGVLSDRYGRRYPLMVAMIGSFINDLCYILVAKYYAHLSIYFLLIGALCDGLTGSFMSLLAATYSYATDIVPPSRRAVAFGYFQCCFYGGIAIGPTLGGYLVKRTHDVLVIFYLAMAIHLIFAMYTFLILPESLSPSRRAAAKVKHDETERLANELLHTESSFTIRLTKVSRFFNIFKVLAVFFPRDGRISVKRNLILLMAIDICLLLNLGIFTIIILYGKLMFDWGDLQQGYLLSIIGGTRVVVLLAVLPLIVRFVRGKSPPPLTTSLSCQPEYPPDGADLLDVWLIRASMVLEVFGFMSFASAPTSTTYYLAGGLSALAGIGMPTLASTLTKHVPSSQTGQLLGAVALMQSLNRVISPIIFGLLYSWTVSFHPATSFVFMAGLMFLGFLLSLGLRTSQDNATRIESQTI